MLHAIYAIRAAAETRRRDFEEWQAKTFTPPGRFVPYALPAQPFAAKPKDEPASETAEAAE